MPLIERLSNGLNTTLDPANLKPGFLSAMTNTVYQPNDPALYRAKGRVAFGTVSATAVDVNGLRDVTFDNGNRYLIAHASASYLTAVMGDSGTFGVLVTGVGVGSQLERVHYRNRFFLLNGVSTSATASAVNSGVVVYLSATGTAGLPITRQHGMKPVNAAPLIATAAGTFSQTVTGYYEYWTTEVAKLTADGAPLFLESTFLSESGPTTVAVLTTATVPTISMPTLQNPNFTTHWRVYRSPKKDVTTDKKFPSGFMISELATATASVSDTITTASASALPTLFNGGSFYTDFASASNLGGSGSLFASATVAAFQTKQQGVYGFSFGGFSGNIQGIVAEVGAYIASGSGPVPLSITIGPDRRSDGAFAGGVLGSLSAFGIQRKTGKSGLITSTNSAALTVLTLGSSTDRWTPQNGGPYVDSDFDANFMAVVTVSKAGVSVGVDYVKLTVYYGGAVDSVVPFPSVIYTFGDTSVQVGKNGPPPSSSTGDLYEDSLVVNDVDNPALIRWSYPGDPEAFPSTYFLDFETAQNDIVRCIKVVNSRLIVGLDTSIWRVNYLPSERDASFDRGKAIEPLSRAYGIVNPMCATTFSPDGGSELLAFVSNKGIHVTDGYSFRTITDALDWRQVISLTSTSTPIALIDDPEGYCLIFVYRNDANGNETYLAHRLHYDQGIAKLRISGPVHMRNFDATGGGYAALKSAWSVARSNGDTSIYWGYGSASAAAGAGKVYIDSGSTLPANNALMSYTTRRIFNGVGSEFRLDDLHAYYNSYSGSPILTYTAKGLKTDDANGEVTGPAKSKTLSGQKMARFSGFSFGTEGLRMTMSASGNLDQGHEFLEFQLADFGLEDSGAGG